MTETRLGQFLVAKTRSRSSKLVVLGGKSTLCSLTRGNHDDQDENDDADDQPHPHLHVLPPHLLADSVGATAEALGRDGQVVGLILQGIQALATLGNFVDVLSHHTNGVVDLLQYC